MPAKYFICPDDKQITISKCLSNNGCRMTQRCATLPYLRACSFDREFKRVSPSMAGNGPRQIYLKAICDYAISPQSRVWALLGTGTHDKLAMHKYTDNVLSEENLSDDKIKGISDVLELNEHGNGYILTDYKTWGSYKLSKALGLYKDDVPSLDADGNKVYYKSGKKEGQLKTHQETFQDESKIDLSVEEYQLNIYRILFEKYGFPISLIRIQAIPRDGSTSIARSRGIDKNIYMIPVKHKPDVEVLLYYDILQEQVQSAFNTGYIRLCNDWENWNTRRCESFCEVKENCKDMSAKNQEKWIV